MRRIAALIAACVLPLAANAQSGTTQSRDGLGTGGHAVPSNPVNGAPAGSENATSGPQSRPAYPSGSDTSNPGAAFVRNQPAPASGTAEKPPGVLSTTTVQGGQATTRPGASPLTTEGAAPLPPTR